LVTVAGAKWTRRNKQTIRKADTMLTAISLLRAVTLCAIVFSVAHFSAVTPAEAFELITPSEAALPAGTIAALDLRGSPTRRPNIIVVSPPPGAGLVHSPLDLKLHFRAFGGGQIDLDSVVVTYIKQPAIDITQRIQPYITAGGIDVLQAEVPPGEHKFWIELKDKDGRLGSGEFTFQVAK
jgi:hypothetical protein